MSDEDETSNGETRANEMSIGDIVDVDADASDGAVELSLLTRDGRYSGELPLSLALEASDELATAGGDGVDYDDVSYAISSDYRMAVIEGLDEAARTPKQIELATGVDIAHVSRSLGELEERGVVRLLTSEDRKKGRIYGLTAKGQALAGRVDDFEEAAAP